MLDDSVPATPAKSRPQPPGKATSMWQQQFGLKHGITFHLCLGSWGALVDLDHLFTVADAAPNAVSATNANRSHRWPILKICNKTLWHKCKF